MLRILWRQNDCGYSAGVDARTDLVAEARRQWRAHGWVGPDRGMAVVISLMRAQQIVLSRLEDVVRPLGLSYARYEVLMLLCFSRRGSLPLARIGERLQVHPASVTGAVAKLEAQGLLVREPHPDDRRAVVARITDEGRRAADAATAALNDGPFADVGLSDEAAEQLVDVIAELRRSAGDF